MSGESCYTIARRTDTMDEKTMVWCTGRHKDGTPVELDGMTVV